MDATQVGVMSVPVRVALLPPGFAFVEAATSLVSRQRY